MSFARLSSFLSWYLRSEINVTLTGLGLVGAIYGFNGLVVEEKFFEGASAGFLVGYAAPITVPWVGITALYRNYFKKPSEKKR